jgi:hypothetical protein
MHLFTEPCGDPLAKHIGYNKDITEWKIELIEDF